MRILKTDDATAGLQAMYLLQIFAPAQQHQNDFQLTTLLEHLGCDTPAEASVTIKDYFYKHIRRVCRCEYDRCLRRLHSRKGCQAEAEGVNAAGATKCIAAFCLAF